MQYIYEFSETYTEEETTCDCGSALVGVALFSLAAYGTIKGVGWIGSKLRSCDESRNPQKDEKVAQNDM